MFRRRRPLMRAAMVGGAGYYAGKKIQEGREQDAPQDEPQQEAAPSAGGMTDEMIDQLGKLGQLHEQGVLTDDEFAAQKQKLLEST
jgi:hypothetical protein